MLRWFDHAASFSTRAEAREVKAQIHQYKTRIVLRVEYVDA